MGSRKMSQTTLLFLLHFFSGNTCKMLILQLSFEILSLSLWINSAKGFRNERRKIYKGKGKVTINMEWS